MTATQPSPPWMAQWPVAYPRPRGDWTLSGSIGWGALEPETGRVQRVRPEDDLELPGLARALRDGNLIGYRVGRRAVVATPDGFIKVVKPPRIGRLVATHESLDGHGSQVQTPTVLAANEDGCVTLSTIPGRSLHQVIRTKPEADVLAAVEQVAAGLVAFHGSYTSGRFIPRPPDSPERWLGIVARTEGHGLPELAAAATKLPALPPLAQNVVHGDLHDKNIFTSGDRIGLIDLDGVRLGAVEGDLANLGVHLQLRALQAGIDPIVNRRRAETLYMSYDAQHPIDHARLKAEQRHTWFRLACLYRYRRTSRHLTAELLRLALDQG